MAWKDGDLNLRLGPCVLAGGQGGALAAHEAGVDAVQIEQLRVGALLHDHAARHHSDARRIAHRAQPDVCFPFICIHLIVVCTAKMCRDSPFDQSSMCIFT